MKIGYQVPDHWFTSELDCSFCVPKESRLLSRDKSLSNQAGVN